MARRPLRILLIDDEASIREVVKQALHGGGSADLVLTHFIEQIGPEESARLAAVLRRPAKRARAK